MFVPMAALFVIALMIGLIRAIPFPLLLLRSAIATIVFTSLLLVSYGMLVRFLPDLWDAMRRIIRNRHQVFRTHRTNQKHRNKRNKTVGQRVNIVVDDSPSPANSPSPTPQHESNNAQAAPATATQKPVEKYLNSVVTADPQGIAQTIRDVMNNSIITTG